MTEHRSTPQRTRPHQGYGRPHVRETNGWRPLWLMVAALRPLVSVVDSSLRLFNCLLSRYHYLTATRWARTVRYLT